MPDILPGFEYSRSASRYRDSSTGRFVSQRSITELLDTQVSGMERRLGALTMAMYEGQLSPAFWAEQMRTELRRGHLQNIALGMGGWSQISAQQFGRAGHALRDDYKRIARLAEEMQRGEVSLPQALNRVAGYAGSARLQYWEAERDGLRQSGREFEERRRLGTAEHCEKCVEFHNMSWQPLGVLPPPGTGTPCGNWCKCTMERREVTE